MEAEVIDHYRDCGSLDIYLARDAAGWIIVEGIERSPNDVLRFLVEIEDKSTEPGAIVGVTEVGERFASEQLAREAFAKRTGG